MNNIGNLIFSFLLRCFILPSPPPLPSLPRLRLGKSLNPPLQNKVQRVDFVRVSLKSVCDDSKLCWFLFEDNNYQTIHQNLSILEMGRAKNINVSRLKMFLDTSILFGWQRCKFGCCKITLKLRKLWKIRITKLSRLLR